MRYILFYIIVVVLTSCITLLSQDVPKFINFMGDSGITDLHPNYLTRGFNDYQEFYKIKVTDNQNLFVNTIFGNLIYQREDYFFNDIGFPIKIEFYYNSGSSFRGRFGNSWQFNYNIRFIENNFNKDFLIVREDDRSILFKKNDDKYIPELLNYSLSKSIDGLKLKVFNDKFLNNGYAEYYFDSPVHNYVTYIQDKNTNKIIFSYNSDKQLVNINFPSGKNVILRYSDNLLKKIVIPNVGEIDYIYDASNNLTDIHYPNGDIIRYKYDSICGKLTEIINSKYIFKIEYNPQFGVQKILYPDSLRFIEYNYDYESHISTINNNYNIAKSIVFDSLYRTIEVSSNGELRYRKLWNIHNLLKTYENANSNTFNYLFDSIGNISKLINPDGNFKEYLWDYKFGNLIEFMDELNNSCKFQYDNQGNLIKVLKDEGSTLNFIYDKKGLPINFESKDFKIDFLNDGYGNFNRIIINNDIEYDINYNNYNDLINISEFNGFDARFDFDHINHKLKIFNNISDKSKTIYFSTLFKPDSIRINNLYSLIYKYDLNGLLTSYKLSNFPNFNISYQGDSIFHIIGDDFNFKFFRNYLKKRKEIKFNNDSLVYLLSNTYQIIEKLRNGKSIVRYNYNANDLISEVIFGDDTNFQISYLPNQLINKIKFPNELNFNYNYDKENRLVGINSGDGRNFQIRYGDKFLDLTLPNLSLVKYTSDNERLLINTNDNQSFIFNLDNYGRIIEKFHNFELTNRYTYNSFGKLISTFNCSDLQISYLYNNLEQLSAILVNDSLKKSFSYDVFGNLIQLSSGDEFIKLFYNQYNNLTRAVDQLGLFHNFSNLSKSFEYKFNDIAYIYHFNDETLLKCINPNLLELNFSLDINNNITKITAPEGTGVSIGYNKSRKINKLTDSYNNSTLINYNLSNNIISLINKNGYGISLKYNLMQLPIEYSDFDSKIYRLFYNYDLYLRKVIFPDQDSITYSYNSTNKVSKFTDWNKNSVSFGWNCSDHITKIFNVIDSIGYTYNDFDQINRITFNNNSETNYLYNTKGLLESASLNDSIKLTYNYDKQDRLIKLLLNNLIILNINYTPSNLIAYIERWGTSSKSFIINNLGQVVEVADNSCGTTKYNYDKLGRLLIVNLSDNSKELFEYDKLSRCINVTKRDGSLFNYSFDNLINPLKIKINNSDSLLIQRNQLGLISYFRNNLQQKFYFEYNPKNMLSRLISFHNDTISIGKNKSNIFNISAGKINSFDLQFDNYNRIISNAKSIIKYADYGLIGEIDYKSYRFDELYRIQTEMAPKLLNYVYRKNPFIPDFVKLSQNIIEIKSTLPSFFQSMKINNDIWNFGRFSNGKLNSVILNDNVINQFYFDLMGRMNQLIHFSLMPKFLSYNTNNKLQNIYFGTFNLNLNYYPTKNLKNFTINGLSYFTYYFDSNHNVLLTVDLEGNETEYIYSPKNFLQQKLFGNGKFINFNYNQNNLIESLTSNNSLQDSIACMYDAEGKLIYKNYKYFDNLHFAIKNESGTFTFFVDSKEFNLFNFSKTQNTDIIRFDRTNFTLKQNIYFDTLDVTGSILFSTIKDDFSHISETHFKTINETYDIKEEMLHNSFPNKIKINDSLVGEFYFDNINRLVRGKFQDSLSISYNDINLRNFIINNSDTSFYFFDSNHRITKIKNTDYSYNLNGSIKEIKNDSSLKRFFYNNDDKLSEIINNGISTRIYYNADGELACIINTDTTYLFDFIVDSFAIKIIYKSKSKALEAYISTINKLHIPILKIELPEKKYSLILRNQSGIPLLKLDTEQQVILNTDVGIFGNKMVEKINDYLFYKDFVFLDELNLYYQNGQFYDAESNLFLNHTTAIKINTLQNPAVINNPLLINIIDDVENPNFTLNQNEILGSTNPFDNQFINIEKQLRNKFITQEFENTFNSFKTFNLFSVLGKEELINYVDSPDNILNRLYPSLSKFLNQTNHDLSFIPKLPDCLLDTFLLNSLNDFIFYLPDISICKYNKFEQIQMTLKLADVDSTFILYKHLKYLVNTLEIYKVNLPSNILSDDILTPNFDEINTFISSGNNLKKFLKENISSRKKSDVNEFIYRQLVPDSSSINFDVTSYQNKLLNTLELNYLSNIALPFNIYNLSKQSENNLRNLFKLLLKPIPTNYNPSQLFYDNQSVYIPLKRFYIDKNFRFPVTYSSEVIK